MLRMLPNERQTPRRTARTPTRQSVPPACPSARPTQTAEPEENHDDKTLEAPRGRGGGAPLHPRNEGGTKEGVPPETLGREESGVSHV